MLKTHNFDITEIDVQDVMKQELDKMIKHFSSMQENKSGKKGAQQAREMQQVIDIFKNDQ